MVQFLERGGAPGESRQEAIAFKAVCSCPNWGKIRAKIAAAVSRWLTAKESRKSPLCRRLLTPAPGARIVRAMNGPFAIGICREMS